MAVCLEAVGPPQPHLSVCFKLANTYKVNAFPKCRLSLHISSENQPSWDEVCDELSAHEETKALLQHLLWLFLTPVCPLILFCQVWTHYLTRIFAVLIRNNTDPFPKKRCWKNERKHQKRKKLKNLASRFVLLPLLMTSLPCYCFQSKHFLSATGWNLLREGEVIEEKRGEIWNYMSNTTWL